MDKYGTPRELMDELLRLGLVQDEQEALEKVAAGAATGLIKEARLRAQSNVAVQDDGKGKCTNG